MIAYNTEDGVSIVIPTGEIPLQDVIAKDVPQNVEYVIVNDIPQDRLFRGAWIISGQSVIEDMDKSLIVAHSIRRARRDNEFEPLDRLATVPSLLESVEIQRQIIRDKYNLMQSQLNECVTVQQLKDILDNTY